MPILIKDYTWSQTADHVRVSVPLRGANARAVDTLDLFTQPTFIKVNAVPYFLELFLAHPIDAAASTTRVYENEIKFRLQKQPTGVEWASLEQAVEKAATVGVKKDIVGTAHELAEQEAKDTQKRKYEIKQVEIQKEIARETVIRESVEALQKEAAKKEMVAIEEMKRDDVINKRAAGFKEKDLEMLRNMNNAVRTKASVKEEVPKSVAQKVTAAPKVTLPKIRQRGTIGVEFSERRFPTPMRESQDAQEQEWLLKQSEARKAIGFVEEDLRPEERNLDWLKDKGNDFFAKKNYLGAVSAFTTAIRMNPKCYDLYMNRATCHYALENWNRCVEDSSKAYELLVPAVASNLKARSQCLAKRGAGLCKLGYLRQGRDELMAALHLVPDNETLRKDIAAVEQALREQVD